jgi:competence protein ComEC
MTPVCGRLICHADTSAQWVGPGTYISFRGRARRIRRTAHPARFDMALYYRNNNIFYECYPKSIELAEGTGNYYYFLRENAYLVKMSIVKVFRSRISDPVTCNIITALTCGYRGELEEDTLNTFSRSGVIHILCVSGLHTGLVFALFLQISRILKFVNKRSRFLWLFLLIPVWIYAFITGLSDSVVRASTMITLYNIARFSNSDISPLNIISGSALIMIMISPHQLLSLGFQLSYLAVIGIIVYHQKLAQAISVKGLIGKWSVGAASISISAQLTTSPLAVYTFNMLPLYFLPANLVAIPAATILVYMSFFFLLFNWLPVISNIVIMLIELVVRGMLTALGFLESLPGSFIEFTQVNWLIPVIIYIIIICTLHFRSGNVHSRLRWQIPIILLVLWAYQQDIFSPDKENSIQLVRRKTGQFIYFNDESRAVPDNCKITFEDPATMQVISVMTEKKGDEYGLYYVQPESECVEADTVSFNVSHSRISLATIGPWSAVKLRFKDH